MTQDRPEFVSFRLERGLSPQHFADLIRTAQLVADPTGGVAGRTMKVNWQSLGVPPTVEQNLRQLGIKYQLSSPYVAPDIIWGQLMPESRRWFLDNRSRLWQFEELFPPADED